jgi:hypothetical protein
MVYPSPYQYQIHQPPPNVHHNRPIPRFVPRNRTNANTPHAIPFGPGRYATHSIAGPSDPFRLQPRKSAAIPIVAPPPTPPIPDRPPIPTRNDNIYTNANANSNIDSGSRDSRLSVRTRPDPPLSPDTYNRNWVYQAYQPPPIPISTYPAWNGYPPIQPVDVERTPRASVMRSVTSPRLRQPSNTPRIFSSSVPISEHSDAETVRYASAPRVHPYFTSQPHTERITTPLPGTDDCTTVLNEMMGGYDYTRPITDSKVDHQVPTALGDSIYRTAEEVMLDEYAHVQRLLNPHGDCRLVSCPCNIHRVRPEVYDPIRGRYLISDTFEPPDELRRLYQGPLPFGRVYREPRIQQDYLAPGSRVPFPTAAPVSQSLEPPINLPPGIPLNHPPGMPYGIPAEPSIHLPEPHIDDPTGSPTHGSAPYEPDMKAFHAVPGFILDYWVGHLDIHHNDPKRFQPKTKRDRWGSSMCPPAPVEDSHAGPTKTIYMIRVGQAWPLYVITLCVSDD